NIAHVELPEFEFNLRRRRGRRQISFALRTSDRSAEERTRGHPNIGKMPAPVQQPTKDRLMAIMAGEDPRLPPVQRGHVAGWLLKPLPVRDRGGPIRFAPVGGAFVYVFAPLFPSRGRT